MAPPPNEQIEQLHQAIAALESQRAVLGEFAVNAALSGLRRKLAELEAYQPFEQRKLVTVLFADLAGFTALTETHGDDDAAEIIARFYDLAQASLTGEARLIKTIGDAVMIVADQSSSAVSTALRLTATALSEAGFPAVRAGLNCGPAVERSGDYFGAAVNLAARVAAYARSDQILCTEIVAESIRGLDIAVIHSVGIASLKNVAQPVELFEIEDLQRHATHHEIDPVCRMKLDPDTAPARLPFEERMYYFCSFACAQKFASTPAAYVK
jgi:class 3 adenylate cyclase